MPRLSALLVLLLTCVPCFADAPASQPSKAAAERAATHKARAAGFCLILNFHGAEDRPLPRLFLSVNRRPPGQYYGAQITEEQAKRIIDALASDGFFDRAETVSYQETGPTPKPGYTLGVFTGGVEGDEECWGDAQQMCAHLARLRPALDGDAAKAVTAMLHRLGYPEPASAPGSRPSEKAQKRATDLKANIEQFSLKLSYRGDQDKPFYNLHLTMTAPPVDDDVFFGRVQLTKEQAGKVVDFLLADGFLERAYDPRVAEEVERPLPCYSLTVGRLPSGEVLYDNLGWAPDMFPHLDALRKVLDGTAGKVMDLLLGRLSGFRAQK